MHPEKPQECDLAVVGAGLAGMSASLFAANRGLSVFQSGGTGGILFASGFLDLLGVHPMEKGTSWSDPWAGIEALRNDIPSHPLARIHADEIRSAITEYLSFLKDSGLPYTFRKGSNVRMITPMGTVKTTYGVPGTMWNGVIALEEKRPCTIIDFHGLKEFNANQIVSTLRTEWPDLQAVRISFPGLEHRSRIFTKHMAQTIELEENQNKLIQRLRPHSRHVAAIGFPAVFGMHRSYEILARLEEAVGVPLFEIPTLPASVPGIRMKETFESHLPARGVRSFLQKFVLSARTEPDGTFSLEIGNTEPEETIRARGVLLATGRFQGKGLYADRNRIRETLFDLPVFQPAARTLWHNRVLMHPRGHPINRAGLEVDARFRPMDGSGSHAFSNLFASGSILAHQDWMRMKCGSGLSIASSYAAVKSFNESFR